MRGLCGAERLRGCGAERLRGWCLVLVVCLTIISGADGDCSTSSTDCPSGWSAPSQTQKRCYKYLGNSNTYTKAQAIVQCTNQHSAATLPGPIDHINEKNQINNMRSGNKVWWGMSAQTTASWTFDDGTDPSTVSNQFPSVTNDDSSKDCFWWHENSGIENADCTSTEYVLCQLCRDWATNAQAAATTSQAPTTTTTLEPTTTTIAPTTTTPQPEVPLTCPSNAAAPSGSNQLSDCICNVGYTGPDAEPCTPCAAGTYKQVNGTDACSSCGAGKYSGSTAATSASTCLTCPSYSSSPAGSDNETDCVCEAGYSGLDGGVCTACSMGKYKALNGSDACSSCGAGKYSGSTAATSASTCLTCALNSISPVGSSTMSDCVCAAGYSGADGGNCTACASGTFKSVNGSAVCTSCSAGTYSTMLAAVSESSCIPCPGHSQCTTTMDTTSTLLITTTQQDTTSTPLITTTQVQSTAPASTTAQDQTTTPSPGTSQAATTTNGPPSTTAGVGGQNIIAASSMIALSSYSAASDGFKTFVLSSVDGAPQVRFPSGFSFPAGLTFSMTTVAHSSFDFSSSTFLSTSTVSDILTVTVSADLNGGTMNIVLFASVSSLGSGRRLLSGGSGLYQITRDSGGANCPCYNVTANNTAVSCNVSVGGTFALSQTSEVLCFPTSTVQQVELTTLPVGTPLPSLYIASTSPSDCSASGGASVVFTFPDFPGVLPTAATVQFYTGGPHIEVQNSEATGLVAAVCPAENYTGSGFGFLMDPAGVAFAQFQFRVSPQQPELIPSRVTVAGGMVSLYVYEAGTNLPSSCKVTFGSSEISIATTMDIEDGLKLDFLAPAVSEAGKVQVGLSCYGTLAVFLEYLELPSVASIVIEDGTCYAQKECQVLVQVDHPAPGINTLQDINVTILGLDIREHSIVTHLIQVNGQSMTLRFDIPAPVSFGSGSIHVFPRSVPKGFLVSEFSFEVMIPVAAPVLNLVSVSPSQVSAESATLVTIRVTGLISGSQLSDLSVSFGNVAASDVSILASDEDSWILEATPPDSLQPGTLLLSLSEIKNLTRSAATEFAILAAGFSAQCIENCESGLAGGAVASFQLSGFANTLPHTAFKIAVGGIAVSAETVSMMGLALAVSATLPALNSSGPTMDAVVVISLSSDSTKLAVASVSYWREPRLQAVRFNSDGSQLLLLFDQDTDAAGTTACASILQAPENAFGIDPICFWSSPSILTVLLGNNASVVPGDLIHFAGPDIRSLNGLSATAPTAVQEILGPDLPWLPELILRAPEAIGTCDIADLLAEGASPRKMAYTWGCINDESLHLLLTSVSSSETSIDGSTVLAEKEYIITVQAVNFLGVKSNLVQHSLRVLTTAPPIVEMLMQPPPYLRRLPLYVSFRAVYSNCAVHQALTVSWYVSVGDVFEADAIVMESSGPDVEIPAGTLDSGEVYTVYLILRSSSGSIEATGSRTFQVGESELISAISGGDRTVYRSDSQLTIDGTESFDPDKCISLAVASSPSECTSELSYEWACKDMNGLSCRSRDSLSMAPFSQAARITVSLASLAVDDTEFLTFSLTVTQGQRSSVSAVRYNLVDTTVIPLQLEVLESSAFRFAVQGNPGETGGTFSWSVNGAGISTDNASSFNLDTSFLPIGLVSNIFIMNLMSDSAREKLVPGSRYSVTLGYSTMSSNGSATVEFGFSVPPSGGTCTSSATKGIALFDSFVLTCQEWTAEDLPLEYRYGSLQGTWDSSLASWTPRTYTRTYGFRLVQGFHSIASQISGSSGASITSVPIQIEAVDELVANGTSNTTELGDQLFNSLFNAVEDISNLGQMTTLIQLSDSIMEDLNSDIPATGRRLLASSQAYRMRVRRLMARKAAEGVGQSVAGRRVGPIISSTQRLSSTPDELTPDSTQSSASLLESASSSAAPEDLRDNAMQEAVAVCSSLVSASQFQATATLRDAAMLKVAGALTVLAQAAIAGMIRGEPARIITSDKAGLQLSRLDQAVQTFLSEWAEGRPVKIALSSLTRRQMGSGDAGVAIMSFGTNWQIDPLKDVTSQSIVGVRVFDRSSLLASSQNTRISQLHCNGDVRCVSVTSALPLPEGSQFNFLSRVGLTCEVFDPVVNKWQGQFCQVGEVSLDSSSNNTAHVECLCSRDGFVLASFQFPAQPVTIPLPTAALIMRYVFQKAAFQYLLCGVAVISVVSLTVYRPLFLHKTADPDDFSVFNVYLGNWEISGGWKLKCQLVCRSKIETAKMIEKAHSEEHIMLPGIWSDERTAKVHRETKLKPRSGGWNGTAEHRSSTTVLGTVDRNGHQSNGNGHRKDELEQPAVSLNLKRNSEMCLETDRLNNPSFWRTHWREVFHSLGEQCTSEEVFQEAVQVVSNGSEWADFARDPVNWFDFEREWILQPKQKPQPAPAPEQEPTSQPATTRSLQPDRMASPYLQGDEGLLLETALRPNPEASPKGQEVLHISVHEAPVQETSVVAQDPPLPPPRLSPERYITPVTIISGFEWEGAPEAVPANGATTPQPSNSERRLSTLPPVEQDTPMQYPAPSLSAQAATVQAPFQYIHAPQHGFA